MAGCLDGRMIGRLGSSWGAKGSKGSRGTGLELFDLEKTIGSVGEMVGGRGATVSNEVTCHCKPLLYNL